MVQQIDLTRFHQAPHLHLFGLKQTDAASVYANFVKGVFEGYCFSAPDHIHLTSWGEHHIAQAYNCSVILPARYAAHVPVDFGGYSGLVDWLMALSRVQPRDQPNELLPFQEVAVAVYAAEHCIIDISLGDEHFRQGFYHSRACTPCDRRRVTDLSTAQPYIQLDFTLSPGIFQSGHMTAGQVRRALRMLRQYRLTPTTLRSKTRQHSLHNFETNLWLAKNNSSSD
jgi:hypothetical protein